ncbi:hypothetical protein KIL84_001742 [Mauremys mutica]|uniref:Uncharacterized protein n=1 Tax=Mauremys mutica TaxID=74926 RepID=A0A9D4B462_9SAUR|nr:hypothetical protein KIL84_001742 [Mauremys mutica]
MYPKEELSSAPSPRHREYVPGGIKQEQTELGSPSSSSNSVSPGSLVTRYPSTHWVLSCHHVSVMPVAPSSVHRQASRPPQFGCELLP